jgi:hypothetical protein
MTPLTTLTTPFTILIDQREKAPFGFSGLTADSKDGCRPLAVRTRFAHLPTGDYTIDGLDVDGKGLGGIAIERKSLADLYSTLGQHRERFEAEHERLSNFAFAAVVIEADWATILQRPPRESRLLPKCVFRTMVSWTQRYGVHWIACPGRQFAESLTFRLLEKAWFSAAGVTSYAGFAKRERAGGRGLFDGGIEQMSEEPEHASSGIVLGTIGCEVDQGRKGRAEEAIEQCNEICELCEEVPERGEDFAISVYEKVKDIRDTIEKTNHVTDAQQQALDNMQAGVKAWIR